MSGKILTKYWSSNNIPWILLFNHPLNQRRKSTIINWVLSNSNRCCISPSPCFPKQFLAPGMPWHCCPKGLVQSPHLLSCSAQHTAVNFKRHRREIKQIDVSMVYFKRLFSAKHVCRLKFPPKLKSFLAYLISGATSTFSLSRYTNTKIRTFHKKNAIRKHFSDPSAWYLKMHISGDLDTTYVYRKFDWFEERDH